MTSQQQNHLTEDELDEALLGSASADRMAHLRECEVCSAHLDPFNSTVATFNQATVAWSEAKSNALSRDLNQHRTPYRISARAAWSCASIVVLAAIASLGLHQRSQQAVASQAKLHAVQVEKSSSQEIASDDAMLRQIDAAIHDSDPSPEELYGIQGTSGTQHANLRSTQVRN